MVDAAALHSRRSRLDDVLDPFEQLVADQGLVSALVLRTLEGDDTEVVAITQ